MGRESEIFIQVSDAVKEQRGLTNISGRNAGDAEERSQIFPVNERKHIISRFAVVDGTGDGIHVGKDEVHSFL